MRSVIIKVTDRHTHTHTHTHKQSKSDKAMATAKITDLPNNNKVNKLIKFTISVLEPAHKNSKSKLKQHIDMF